MDGISELRHPAPLSFTGNAIPPLLYPSLLTRSHFGAESAELFCRFPAATRISPAPGRADTPPIFFFYLALSRLVGGLQRATSREKEVLGLGLY